MAMAVNGNGQCDDGEFRFKFKLGVRAWRGGSSGALGLRNQIEAVMGDGRWQMAVAVAVAEE
jgi:hypothetical protein